MKTKYLYIKQFVIAIFALIISGETTIYCQNLVAHYPLDNNATDMSSNKNDGILFGNVRATSDLHGNPCGALMFDGTGYIEVPSSASINSINQFLTITCWFKLSKQSAYDENRRLSIVCKGNHVIETKENPHFRLQSFQSNLQSTISVNSEFTEYDTAYLNHKFEFEQWYFYALAYDGQSVKTYLNGEKIFDFVYTTQLSANNDPLTIGKDVPGATEYFIGSLDDLRIYNSALSHQQITQLYRAKLKNPKDGFEIICPASLTVNAGINCYAVVNYSEPIVNITCGYASVKQVEGLPSGSKFPMGINNLIYEAVNEMDVKKRCFARVSVVDKIPPTINCQNSVSLMADPNSNGKAYRFDLPAATDNCSIQMVKMSEGLPSGSLFPFGDTKLKFTATDKSGNTSECSYIVHISKPVVVAEAIPKTNSVVVIDGEKPALNCCPKDTIIYVADTNIFTKVNQVITVEIDTPQDNLLPKEKTLTEKTLPDSVKFVETIFFKDTEVTLLMYDNGKVDHDTVSIFFNGDEIVSEEMIKKKSNGAIMKVVKLNPKKKMNLLLRPGT